jgi:hypothetical protein
MTGFQQRADSNAPHAGWLADPGVERCEVLSNNETELLSIDQLAIDRSF